MKKVFLLFLFIIPVCLPAQTAAATNPATLHEAFTAAAETSIDQPVIIILLADIVLDEPLIVADRIHIRLTAEGADRTIRRSANQTEYPVIWLRGESSSLTLGSPYMEYELVIDGGYLNEPPIQAHAPLIAVNGLDAKLIMLDGVTLQNNYNKGQALSSSHHQNGAGVFIRTHNEVLSATEDNADRQAEFIMKGGIIRGNRNDVQSYAASGGGVLIAGFGIFTMEGGVIMNNTAQLNGGGFHTQGYGSFKKTGGIIYGADAPAEYRNTAIEGFGEPLNYGHAVSVNIHYDMLYRYRNNTVSENDNLSYTGTSRGNGIFGKGEKWDYPSNNFRLILFILVLSALALGISVLIVWRKLSRKEKNAPQIDPENFDLSPREKEIFDLLLTSLSIKQIAYKSGLTVSGVKFHTHNLYRKFGVQSRTELLARHK
ncbi:MAG: LuxR C-terminal-related transcriptional regulator [Treponema sp.]|nr:LuxR C-terminal-related transcriptional regulator [Treponema sp.]